MRRALITGGGGFLGRALGDYLAREKPGLRLLRLGRRSGPGLTRLDLRNVPRLAQVLRDFRPDVIFHLAGTTEPGPWDRLFEAHVAATVGLLEAVRRAGPPFPRVVNGGSAAEYGNVPAGRQPIAETAPARPLTDYAYSKSLQTAAALAYAEAGLPVVAARIFNILDPAMPGKFVFPKLLAALRAQRRGQRPAALGSLDASRDFLSLPDTCRALVSLAVRGRGGEVYNVCSGRALRLRHLWNAMRRAAGIDLPAKETAPGSRRSRARDSLGSRGKIRRHTGWRPLDDALRIAVAAAAR